MAQRKLYLGERLEEIETNTQYYIVPGKFLGIENGQEKYKTHLAYISDCSTAWGDTVYLLCLPNIPVMMCNCGSYCPTKHDPDCGVEADENWAKQWDECFNEVTCEACLRRAKG